MQKRFCFCPKLKYLILLPNYIYSHESTRTHSAWRSGIARRWNGERQTRCRPAKSNLLVLHTKHPAQQKCGYRPKAIWTQTRKKKQKRVVFSPQPSTISTTNRHVNEMKWERKKNKIEGNGLQRNAFVHISDFLVKCISIQRVYLK